MPSLDFVYDLTEKLDEEQDLNYLVLTIREGSKEDKVDVFFRIDPHCEEVFSKSIESIKEVIEARQAQIDEVNAILAQEIEIEVNPITTDIYPDNITAEQIMGLQILR